MDVWIHRLTQQVAEAMSDNDGSHDIHHVKRVQANALKLLKMEQTAGRMSHVKADTVSIGALLHDMKDHKYSQVHQDISLDPMEPQEAKKALTVMNKTGWSKEQAQTTKGEKVIRFPELDLVSDADRLDAMGAVGIARTFMFGGARGLTIPQVVYHYHEKLQYLQSSLRTPSARQLGKKKHETLSKFFTLLESEL